MKKHPGVCTGCSTGCSMWTEENQDHIYRLKPRENPHVNHWWLCDEGRYGFHFVHSDERQIGLRRREATGAYVEIDWSILPDEMQIKLSAAGRLAGVLSPHLTVEEAYLLAKYLRGFDPEAVLALGPVPMGDEDERFKNGFTIRAEKCPNRHGVEAVIRHFTGACPTFYDLLPRIEQGEFGGVWVTGGYKEPAYDVAVFDQEIADQFDHVKLLIVQDIFASPLWDRADYQLAGGTFAERDGSYVNFADRLQSAKWAVRPPAGAWAEGPLYWRLLNQPGLYNSRKVLSDVAAEIIYFAAAADEVPATGVDLKINQLAMT
jgi:NADH-quinone oxidoreductase subunit G